MKNFSLQNVISRRRLDSVLGWMDHDFTLSDTHKNNFLELFGKGCQRHTKEALSNAVNNNFRGVKSCGILGRVEFCEDGRVSYCAGQDYPSEVAFVRNWIKKYY